MRWVISGEMGRWLESLIGQNGQKLVLQCHPKILPVMSHDNGSEVLWRFMIDLILVAAVLFKPQMFFSKFQYPGSLS